MPTFRPDLDAIPRYVPGKPVDEVARDLGLSDIVKIGSNENPEAPFPEVVEAVRIAASSVNRYPQNDGHDLVRALAGRLGCGPEHIWLGSGSNQLLQCTALVVGGSGTSGVFADPSFGLYPVATAVAGAEPIAVPTDTGGRLDLEAMLRAVRADTTVVYVCNPNNPTGTYVSGDALGRFIESVPSRILVVVDEAYAEFATAPDFASAVPLALERDNVVVTRTFSKAYGLAGLRVGYAIGWPETLAALRRVQIPFPVNALAQAGAMAALRFPDRLAERVARNAAGREALEDALAERGLAYLASQANFVLFDPPGDASELADALLHEGVIVRLLGTRIRVSVGTGAETERFLAALDRVADLSRAPGFR